MEKLIDGILTAAYFLMITFGAGYTLQKAHNWMRYAALEKVATGLGSLEKSTQTMTGGKLDF
jgi:hypothetical protein